MPHAAPTFPTVGTRGLVAVDGRTFPLRSARLDARAEGGLAESVLVQSFANPHAEPLEVLYTMPLPADGAVVGYTFRLGERVVRGRIEAREQARESYLRALEKGHTAGLLEQQRADVFVQRLGNLPPGAEVSVEIRVLHPLAFEASVGTLASRWVYRFPTVVGVRYHGAPGRVPDADAIDAPRADANGTGVRIGGSLRLDDGSLVELGERSLDRDVVHAWPAGAETPRARLVEGPGLEGDDGRYALLVVTPPVASNTRPQPRDLTILLDASGSMSGEPLAKAKEVVDAMLRSLAPNDRFELIAFASSPNPLTRGVVDANPAAIDNACRELARLEAGGGTEMRKALETALAPLRSEAQRQIVLVTDGQIGFEEEIVSVLRRKLPERSRVHVVGIGSAPNRTLTLGASRAGRGVEVLVGDGDDAAEPAERLVRATAAPVLTEIRVNGRGVVGIAPARPRDLFAGEPLRVFVELKPAGGEVVVTGAGAEGTWSASLSAPATLPEGPAGLPFGAFFGREQATDLEAEGVTGPRMCEVGLRHHIVTPETSLVAISEDPTVDPRDPRRVEKLAVELPAGVSAEGVGYARLANLALTLEERAHVDFLGVSEPKAPASMLAHPGRLSRLLRRAERRRLVVPGRLVRTDGTEFVIELEVPDTGFERTGSESVVLQFGQARLRGAVVEPTSTRPGACPAGTTVRLVLRRLDSVPLAKDALLRVHLVGGPDGDLTIELESPGA